LKKSEKQVRRSEQTPGTAGTQEYLKQITLVTKVGYHRVVKKKEEMRTETTVSRQKNYWMWDNKTLHKWFG
jgi:hypothetical protein